MKRITLFLLLALYLSLQAFAQIRIGVDAGMNLTHFKSSDNYVQKIGGMGTGFQIGGTLDYEFKKHWTAHWTSNLRLTARRYMRNGIR